MGGHEHDDTRDDEDARDTKGGFTRRRLLLGLAAGGAAGTLLGSGVTQLAAAGGKPSGAAAQFMGPPPALSNTPQLREYWLQAESFLHDLAPSGRNDMMGTHVLGSQFWALGYRAYTPGWGKVLPGNDDIGANDGIPGPTLRAAVGDKVRVHLRNADTHYGWPHSLHSHGWMYTPASDGAWTYVHLDAPGVAIAPGHHYTYEYTVPPDSVGTWPYHDHSTPRMIMPNGTTMDDDGGMGTMELGAQLGLIGTIVITDRHTKPVDREIVLFMHDMYQSDVPALSQDFDCFNGRAFIPNTPEIHVKVGDRVRWRIAALGAEFHAFHLHGHRWNNGIRNVDSEILGPSTTLDIEYTENNPGEWLYHCHVVDHFAGGMVGWYVVDK
ncbi:MAG TPA: multicopper oxidase domain-containing protein [Acidimicrobiia bacterium]|nr:multicopper oxidase domain-containing protein [Acidimicrobiia bacterium]